MCNNCNNGFGGNNCLWIIVLLIVLWSCCGNNGIGGCNNGCNCGCNNGCNNGCGNCGCNNDCGC